MSDDGLDGSVAVDEQQRIHPRVSEVSYDSVSRDNYFHLRIRWDLMDELVKSLEKWDAISTVERYQIPEPAVRVNIRSFSDTSPVWFSVMALVYLLYEKVEDPRASGTQPDDLIRFFRDLTREEAEFLSAVMRPLEEESVESEVGES